MQYKLPLWHIAKELARRGRALAVVLYNACGRPVVDGVGLDVNTFAVSHGVENFEGFLYLPIFGTRLYQAGESWRSGYEGGICDCLLHLPSSGYGKRNSHLQTIHVARSLRGGSLP